MAMTYEYRCDNCNEVVDKLRDFADRNEPFPCDCGGTYRRKPSAPTVNWNTLGALSSDWPSASDRWERERQRQAKREKENVANHGPGEEMAHRFDKSY